MRVLALDLATKSGWAADDPENAARLRYGIFEADCGPISNGGNFARFERWLDHHIEKWRPEVIAFEAPMIFGNSRGRSNIITNQHAVRTLLGLVATTELVVWSHRLPIMEVNVRTIKKHFTGRGNAEKSAIFEKCRALGYTPQGFDDADAIALWDYAKHKLGVPVSPPINIPIFESGRVL